MPDRNPNDEPHLKRDQQRRFEWADERSTADAGVPSASAAQNQPDRQPEEPAANSKTADPSINIDMSVEPCFAPGHPWHYYHRGDHADPIPFEEIPPNGRIGQSLADDMPKTPARRIAKVRMMLETERSDLEERRVRYEAVVERGAETLSNYDRLIHYGGDIDLARAQTLALLFNQIAGVKGRIAWLELQTSKQSGRQR